MGIMRAWIQLEEIRMEHKAVVFPITIQVIEVSYVHELPFVLCFGKVVIILEIGRSTIVPRIRKEQSHESVVGGVEYVGTRVPK